MKFVMECLNHFYPALELTPEKAIRLGPGATEAPLSRIEAYPDYKNGKVRIKNLGTSKGLLNFLRIIKKGDEVSGVPGDLVDLTFATFVYRICKVDEIPRPPIKSSTMMTETRSQLEIALNPRLSQMVSEDISSTLISPSQVESSSIGSGSFSSIGSETYSGLSSLTSTTSITEQLTTTIIKKPTQQLEWLSFEGILGSLPVLVYGENVQKMKPKVAGFDLDGTIIVPDPNRFIRNISPSGHISKGTDHPRGIRLWKFAFDNTKETLVKFFNTHSDHKFLIVTNKANRHFEVSQRIIEEVVQELDIPVIVFAAKEATQFLKPAPSCWEIFRKHFNEELTPDFAKSFFCGDAAGRPGDISKGDRLFALNNGMEFKTPEAFFQGTAVDETLFEIPTFIPKEFVQMGLNNDHITFPHNQEIILMCGYPGSGKTWYSETTLIPKGYVHVFYNIHNPEMATQKKRLHAIETALASGRSVVVDKRHIDQDERDIYIRMGNTLEIPIRCFLMNVTAEQALHNLRFHELKTGELYNSSEVELGLKRFKGLYEPPTVHEGFSEIVYVNFVPHIGLNHAQLTLYSKFLIPR